MTGIVHLQPHSRRGILQEGFLRLRTALVVPLVLLVFAGFLTVGILTMDIPSGVTFPGPRVFPSIIAAACAIVAVLFAIDIVRHPEPAEVAPRAETRLEAARPSEADESETDPEAVRVRSNYRALLSAVAVLVVFTAALAPVGWVLSGAFLFWGVAWALGSRRPIFDIVLAIAISSIVQLAFSAGLGLNLPPGILAGVL